MAFRIECRSAYRWLGQHHFLMYPVRYAHTTNNHWDEPATGMQLLGSPSIRVKEKASPHYGCDCLDEFAPLFIPRNKVCIVWRIITYGIYLHQKQPCDIARAALFLAHLPREISESIVNKNINPTEISTSNAMKNV